MSVLELAWVALGSNLGSPREHVCVALEALRGLSTDGQVAASRLYETDPVGPGVQAPYLNAVVRFAPRLEPRPLLHALQAIEAERGRRRGPERNAPRTLDLDLLLYGRRRIEAAPELVVPHPRIEERPFVLEPLCDLDPDLCLPGGSRPVRELAAAVRDPAAVRPVDPEEDMRWPWPPSASRQ